MKATGHSLWLMPINNSEPHLFLQSLIEDLAHLVGGPFFPPHVTLLGGMQGSEKELIDKSAQAAVCPLEIERPRGNARPFYWLYLKL